MLIIQEISDSPSKAFLLYGSYLVPGGGVTFVWSTMLEHVFKVPLAFIQRTLKPLLFGRTREMPLLA